MATPIPPSARPLIIIGASCRAAAFSSIRAGFLPFTADRFGDADLRHVASWESAVDGFPESLASALERLPEAPWIFTGGLDGRPALVERLERRRALWGCGGAVLRAVRDPFRLSKVLEAAGVPMPEVRPLEHTPERLSEWLLKSRGGGAGATVSAAATPGSRARRRQPEAAATLYYQRRVSGAAASALFVASARGAELLGATTQLTGAPWLHAAPYAWCGNIGPLHLPDAETRDLRAVARAVHEAFGLRGLFGIDFLRAEDGAGRRIVPIEVNARYTGAVEVLEQAMGFAAMTLHARACERSEPTLPANEPSPRGPGGGGVVGVVGKAVLYAPRDLRIDASLLERFPARVHGLPLAADLPMAGARILRGAPVLTLFSRASSAPRCEERLRRRASEVMAWLRHPAARSS